MVTQLFYFFAFIESLTIDEDYDANSRNPYSYKYSIDDPESDTNFEVNLSLLNTKKNLFDRRQSQEIQRLSEEAIGLHYQMEEFKQ